MTTKTHRDTLRTLATATALAGSLFAFAGSAAAQNTPNLPTVTLGTNIGFGTTGNPTALASAGDGPVAAIDGSSTGLTVDLNTNTASIINWNGFSIANGSTTTFTSALAGQVAVLNRVTGGSMSTLSGALNSGGNVNVFLLNPNGILVGSTGAINTGSFVASTLDISDADFQTNSYGFTGAANATAGIEVQPGAVINTAGGTRGLVLVAPRIVSYGALDGGTQDVAFVTATDTRLTFNPGSPLGIVINRGTAVPGASQVIGNTVNGQNVYFALASQAGINDALLQVDASVTTAVASDRGIVLIAGQSTADPNVRVNGGADTSGIAGLRLAGLTSNAAGSTIFGRASGDITANSLTAGGTVSLGAVGTTTINGPVAAGGDYTASGQSVALSGFQRAAGAVTITANGGSITDPNGLTLIANGDGVGAEALTLRGAVNLSANGRLDGGTARQSAVVIDTAATNGLSLGNVNADTLNIAFGGRLDGAITTGAITTNGALTLRSNAAVTTGALTGGSGYIESTGGAVSIGAASFGGGGLLVQGDSIGFTTIDAGSAVLQADVGGIAGTRITTVTGNVDLTSAQDVLAGAITSLNGAVTITASGGLTSGPGPAGVDINAATAIGVNTGTLARLGALTGGSVQVAADQISVGSVTSPGTVSLIADVGGLGVAGTVTGSAITLHAATYTGLGGAVTGTGAVQVRGAAGIGFISIAGATTTIASSAGAIFGSSASATGALDITGDSVSLNSASSTNGALTIGTDAGALSVRTVTSGGAATLQSATDLFVDSVTTTGGALTASAGATIGGVSPGNRANFSGSGVTQLVAGGSALLGTVASTGAAVDLRAASVDALGVTAAGTADVRATAGAVTLGGLGTTAGNATVSATGTATIAGPVTVGGGYTASGQNVALSGVQSATGAVSITATAGTITNPAALTLTSNSDGVGTEALTLTGAVILGANSTLAGGGARQSDVVIDTPAAGGLTLGNVSGNNLLVAFGGRLGGPITTGDLNFANAVSLRSSGNVTTGALTAGTAFVEAIDSAVTLGAVTTSGAFRADASRIDFTTIDAGSVALNAIYANNGGIAGTRIGSAGAVTLNTSNGAGGVAIGTLTSGDLTAYASGDIVLGTVGVTGTTTLTTQTNPADIRITGGLIGTGNVTLTSTRNVQAMSLASNGALTINALAGSVTGLAPTGRADLTAGGLVRVNAGALARLGAVSGGSIDVTATQISADSAATTTLTGPLRLVAGAGGLDVGGAISGGGAVTLQSGGATSLAGAVTGGTVLVSGASVNFASIAGTTTTISGGTVTGGSASATNALGVTGGTVTVASLASTNGPLEARATAGSLQVGSVTSGGTTLLDQAGVGTLSVGAVTGTGAITLRSDGDTIAGGAIQGTGAVSLTSSSNIRALSATSGGALTLTATSGEITGLAPTGQANLTAAGLVQVRAGTLARLGAITGGSIDVTAAQILATSAAASPTSKPISLVAGAGGLAVSGAVNGGALTLRSGGATTLDGAVTGTTVDVRGTASVGFASIAGTTTMIAGGTVTGGSASGANGLTVTGSDISITTLNAANGALAVTATNGSLGFGTASGQSIGLTQTGAGGITGSTVTSTAGALRVDSDGAMSLGTVSGTGGATTLTTHGAGATIAIGTSVGGSGPVSLTATGDIRAPLLTSNGALNVTAAGSVTGVGGGRVTLTATGAVGVGAGALALLGPINGASISVNANQIVATSATTPGGGIGITAGTGGLRVDGIVNGGVVTLGSSGVTSLGGAVAGTTVGVNGATSIDLTSISGSNTTNIAGGSVVGTSASGANGLTVTGSGINIGALAASNGALSATATGGVLAFGSATARSAALTQTGAGGAINGGTLTTTAGALTATSEGTMTLGTVFVTGGTTLLRTQTNPADIVITGSVSGDNDVTLTSTRDVQAAALTSRAGSLFVNATNGQVTGIGAGRADLTAASNTGVVQVRGGTLARLGAIGGGSIDVTAAQIVATSAVTAPTTGPISLVAGAGGLTVDNAVTGGTLTLGSTGATSLTGTVTGGTVNIAGSTSVGFATVTGANTTITGGAVSGTTANGATSLTIGGSSINVGTAASSAGSVTLNSTGTLAITTLARAQTALNATATGALSIDTANVIAGDATLTSTGGDATLRTATVSGNLTVNAATGTATLADAISAGGNYRIRAGSVALGVDAGSETQSAGGLIDITATTGGITGGTGLALATTGGTASTIALDAAQGIAFGSGSITAGGSGNAALGLRAGSGQGIDLGALVRAGSIVSVSAGPVRTFATQLTHSGNFTAGQVDTGVLNINLTAGNIQTGAVTTATTTTLATAGTGTITTGAIRATGATAVTSAGSGAVNIASIGATGLTGAVTLTGGTAAITTGPVFGSTITASSGGNIAATGTLTSSGATTLTTSGSGAITTAAIAAGGAAQLTAGAGTISTGTIGAGTVAVSAGGAVSVGATTATAATPAATTLSLTSTGGNVTAGGALVSTGLTAITAGGTANLQAITAGPAITITAADAELNGAVQAAAVSLINNAPAAGTRLGGDGLTAGGFRLSQTEINRITTPTLTLGGGTGAVTLEALALTTAAGSSAVNVLTTGDLSVTGAVSSPAVTTARTIRLGGNAAGTTGAQSIRVITTPTAGGRLALDGATIDLRAQRVAVGEANFVASLFPSSGPLSGTQVAGQFVTNPNSALYNALVGGVPYTNQTVITARQLTITYGDFALVQNTGPSGLNLGAVLGGTTASPVNGALTLQGPGTAIPNSFALFGTINGVGGAAASVLGGTVVVTSGITIPNSRVNGCIIGSGAGCLTTTITQPTLNVFDASRLDIFSAADDFTLPFDPVVGSNNEALFAGVAAIDMPPPPECDDGDDATNCPAPEEKKQ